MGGFTNELIRENQTLLDQIWRHPLLVQIGSGTLPEMTFHRWLHQSYLLSRSYEQVLATLATRSPDEMRNQVVKALLGMHQDLELFEEFAAETANGLRLARKNFACHAYTSYLVATVHVRSFEECLVAFFASDYAFLRAWPRIGAHGPPLGVPPELVELLQRPSWQEWLEALGGLIDKAAEGGSADDLRRMKETFPIPIHYQYQFVDSFLKECDW